MKHLFTLKTIMLACLLFVGMGAWGDSYVQLTSIAGIDESAEYVLGIDGTGFHKSGTSSWGVCTNSGVGTPLKYKLVKAADGNSFKASTQIEGTTYYLTVPTSNTFTMATSNTASNTDMIIGTTQVTETNYAVANKTTTARHLRINGTSGLRSYAGTTGTMAFFYKVVSDGPTVTSLTIKTAPTKTTYMVGETFDPTGLVITKNLSNSTTEDVTYSKETMNDFTFNPSLSTILSSETSVSISYGGKTTTQAITVNPFVATAGKYKINMNNGLYGISTGNNATEQSVSRFDITITSGCTSNASSKTYYDANHIRYYANSYLKLTAPTGFEITKVVFDTNDTWNSGPKCGSNGTYNNTNKTWEGKTSQLDLNFTDQNRISSISVTYAVYVAPDATYTVTFDAGSNGTCATSQLTEASVGVGVTLPEATPNTGWDFVGWSTSATPTDANAGAAGATYHPTADCTLYAYYTKHIPSFSGSYIDIDLSTDNTTTATENELTWNNAFVNIVAAKAEATANANNYYPGTSGQNYSSTRFYKNSTLTFTPSTGVTITGIEYTATSNDYTTAFENSTWTNGDAVADAANKIAYVTPTNGTQAVSATIGATTGGTKFRVYYSGIPTATITLNAACNDGDFVYSTYSNGSNWIVPAELVVSEVCVVDGELAVYSYNEGDVVPANAGVMVAAEKGGNYSYSVTLTNNAATDSPSGGENSLVGTGNSSVTAAEMTKADTEFFRLTMHNGNTIGFFWGAENGAAFDLGANKAYLAVATENLGLGGDAKGGRLWINNSANGIKTVNAEATVNKAVKRIMNGQLIIEKAGKMYNAAGAEMK